MKIQGKNNGNLKAVILTCTVAEIVGTISAIFFGVNTLMTKVTQSTIDSRVSKELYSYKDSDLCSSDIRSKIDNNYHLLDGNIAHKTSENEENIVLNKENFIDWARTLDDANVQSIIAKYDREIQAIDELSVTNGIGLTASVGVGVSGFIAEYLAQKKIMNRETLETDKGLEELEK